MKRLLITALLAVGTMSLGVANAQIPVNVKPPICLNAAAVEAAGAQDVMVKVGDADWGGFFGRLDQGCYPMNPFIAGTTSTPIVFKNNDDARRVAKAFDQARVKYELVPMQVTTLSEHKPNLADAEGDVPSNEQELTSHYRFRLR